MGIAGNSRSGAVFLSVFLLLSGGCNRHEEGVPDHPRLTPNVTMRDVTFRSRALDRDMHYRVVFPANAEAHQKLAVVYLLHGGGGGFRDWSNYSDVARQAESGLLLVMPEGAASYYSNSVERPQDRYEDYIVSDLISDVESRFPVATGQQNRGIAGVSMGGFGAIKLALRHPGLFAFAGGISPAIDVPRRPFSIRRIQQSRHYNSIFGPSGSKARAENDPFVLVRSVDSEKTPYLYISCGDQEGLLPPNREFAALLAQRHFRYEFHTAPGGHNWNQWNERVPSLFQVLRQQLGPKG